MTKHRLLTYHTMFISKPFKINILAEKFVPPDSVVGRVAGPETAAKHTTPAVEPMESERTNLQMSVSSSGDY